MVASMEDVIAGEAVVETEDPELQEKTKGKKTKWKKTIFTDFWEPPPYVCQRKGQGQSPQSGSICKQGPKGGKGEKVGHKGSGKGREKGCNREYSGGKGTRGTDGLDQKDHVESGLILPRRGTGAYAALGPATAIGEEGFEDWFNVKGRRDGGKRGGKGFDGKDEKRGRFTRDEHACGRKSGRGKGRPHGSASDMQGTNVGSSSQGASAAVQGPVASNGLLDRANNGGGAQPMPIGRMPCMGGAAAPAPMLALCDAMPFGATLLPADATGSKGVAAFPAAPMPFAAEYNAMPCYGNAAMATTYPMPHFVMPAKVVGYPQFPAAATGTTASGPSFAFPPMSQDGGAGPLPPNPQGMPFMPIATQTFGGGAVKNRLMEQMEYHFSTENLVSDMYLRVLPRHQEFACRQSRYGGGHRLFQHRGAGPHQDEGAGQK